MFTPNDSVTVTVTFNGHCDGQNGLHTHFAYQCNVCNVCYSDSDEVAWCEQAFRPNLIITLQMRDLSVAELQAIQINVHMYLGFWWVFWLLRNRNY